VQVPARTANQRANGGATSTESRIRLALPALNYRELPPPRRRRRDWRNRLRGERSVNKLPKAQVRSTTPSAFAGVAADVRKIKSKLPAGLTISVDFQSEF
jgi:hypothetical protein